MNTQCTSIDSSQSTALYSSHWQADQSVKPPACMQALMHAAQRHACSVQMVHILLWHHCAHSMHRLYKIPHGARKLIGLPTSNSSLTTALTCNAHFIVHDSGLLQHYIPFPSSVDTENFHPLCYISKTHSPASEWCLNEPQRKNTVMESSYRGAQYIQVL